MSEIHLELLDKERLKIFQNLLHFRRYGYLAGGTALAFQLNHRRSVDFDIFVSQEIKPRLFKECKEIFGKNLLRRTDNRELLVFTTPQQVDITFVYYEYKTIFPLVKTPSISLAALNDIAADKAYTVGHRATWRDYVDTFFLIKKGKITLSKIIGTAQKKFAAEFNENLFLEQLVYFADVEMTPISFVEKPYSENQIKNSLEEETRKYLRKVLR